MIIYENKNKVMCYIHIPKNSGKFIRKKIRNNPDNKILKNYWGNSSYIDKAHIPFMCKNSYVSFLKGQYIKYYTYTRNPYNRIISAFFYLNSNCNISDFKLFIRNTLTKYDFNKKFNTNYIHYYPQYMFICNSDFQINEVKFEKLEENFDSIKVYNLLDYFDLDNIKIINEIYKKDFEIFNYDMISVL